jgi:NAD(P)-dependent dehydrogenase (short-subunit alcohol dehydrogenase family)
MTDLNGRLVAITGGALGIGRGITEAIVGAGARVAVIDFDADGLKELESALTERGSTNNIYFHGDTTSTDEVGEFFDLIAADDDPLYGLVNNVGGGGPTAYTPFIDLDPEAWKSVVAINLYSPYLCSRLAAKQMKEAGEGRIVNIASIAGSRAIPGLAAYSAAKAGVIAFTRSAAIELARDNILVNAVSPGHVLTETAKQLVPKDLQAKREAVIPAGRYGTPEDIANAVLFGLGGATWFTGNLLNVDGGMAAAMLRPID